jgi:hypothetical protein
MKRQNDKSNIYELEIVIQDFENYAIKYYKEIVTGFTVHDLLYCGSQYMTYYTVVHSRTFVK